MTAQTTPSEFECLVSFQQMHKLIRFCILIFVCSLIFMSNNIHVQLAYITLLLLVYCIVVASVSTQATSVRQYKQF